MLIVVIIKGQTMNWMRRGSSAVESEIQRREEEQKNKGPYRFFLKTGEMRNVIFLDGDEPDEPISIMEHIINIPGAKFPELLTCPGRQNGCPLCIAGNQARFVAFYSIVDTTPYEDSQGKTIKNVKKILAVKSVQADILIKKRKDWDGLKGRVVTISRTNDKKSASSGDQFERFIKDDKPLKYNIDKSKPEHASIDWSTVLAPKPISELKHFVEFANYNPWNNNGAKPATNARGGGFDSDFGSTSATPPAREMPPTATYEDDVPF